MVNHRRIAVAHQLGQRCDTTGFELVTFGSGVWGTPYVRLRSTTRNPCFSEVFAFLYLDKSAHKALVLSVY